MTYRCIFPNCQYETDDRSLIEFHHIHPKELGVRLNREVTIPLCPTHHKMIYHPGATAGQHAERHEGSLSVVQVATTTTGKAVQRWPLGWWTSRIRWDQRGYSARA